MTHKCPVFGECYCEHPVFLDSQKSMAVLKLTERGTDNGWVDDEAVELAMVAALRACRKLVQVIEVSQERHHVARFGPDGGKRA